MDEQERIVVTGMGVISPYGLGVEVFHQGLAEGRSGISTIEFPWKTGYKVLRAGRIAEADYDRLEGFARSTPRSSLLATAASRMAWQEAGWESAPPPRGRAGLVVGTTLGDSPEFEIQWQAAGEDAPAASPAASRNWMGVGSLVERTARSLLLGGPAHLVATTCAAGNHAIAWSSDLIRSGRADVMVAAATDTLGFVEVLGFTRLLLQAPEFCQPFDLHRKGTILSEGAGALVLERLPDARRRGARILAEVAGYGLSCDAGGAFASRGKDIRGLRIAADRALSSARLSPAEIDHVNAHGSGTKLNDRKETYFLKQVLGDRAREIPISGIKSMLGHAQGSASMFEAIASVLTLTRNYVYPTTNYQTPDPACDLDYVPNRGREQRVDTILSNAFGVGGNNALLVFRRWEG